MKAIADQDTKKAKKVFHCHRLRDLGNYDSADIKKKKKIVRFYRYIVVL